MKQAAPRLHAVVLAGGSGERFWPRSRRGFPKPLLPVLGGGSLLEATLARVARVVPAERTWVVCARQHAARVRAAAGLPRGHVWVEPEARNTAMATGFAAARLAAADPDAVLAVLPSDHAVGDPRAFAAALRRAARAAAGSGALVTLGVRPTRAETAYGWIEVGAPAGSGHRGLFRVRRFEEKPPARKARRWLARGGFLWNSGIFVWRAAALLEEIERCAPALAAALAPVRRRPRGPGSRAALARAYRSAPALPVDRAVLERSRRVWTLPVDFPWSDVGSWGALAEELGVAPGRSRRLGGEAVLVDAPGNLVWGGGRLVALLGVEGLAVIDAGDALLVSRLDRAGEVRRVVERLRQEGRDDLL